MSVPATWTDYSSDSAAKLERPTPREQRADHAAAQQELILRRSDTQCGGGKSPRYNLVYERYNQPVATNMTLTDIEVWLGIRGTTRY